MNTNTSTRMETQFTGNSAALSQPQLELAFAQASAARLVEARPRRQSRARWWFERMRQIVDEACDWQPALTPRPEQTWFSNTYRTPSAAPLAIAQQQQICE
jgi:hypothetical protein